MVLAKSKGVMKEKLTAYKVGLKHLEEKIQCKINSILDMDNKQDLMIMLENVMILKKTRHEGIIILFCL